MSEVPLYTNQEDHMFLLVAIFLIHILSYNTLTITSGLDLKKNLYIMIEIKKSISIIATKGTIAIDYKY